MKKVILASVILAGLFILVSVTDAIAPNTENTGLTFRPVTLVVDPSDHPPAATPTPTPAPTPKITPKPPIKNLTLSGGWVYDREVSWYGPGFYGNRTACGLAYTTTILGVAHRSLPCGTLVEFRYNGINAVVPVIDRGPYVGDRTWDLSGGLCVYLNHCFTGPIEYRIVK